MAQAKSIGIAVGKALTPSMGLAMGFHIQNNNLGHGFRLWHGHSRGHMPVFCLGGMGLGFGRSSHGAKKNDLLNLMGSLVKEVVIICLLRT